VFDKLLVNFTWWVNLEDRSGTTSSRRFLGLDNIGPIDRSHLPVGGTLEQSDATNAGWRRYAGAGLDRRDPAAPGDGRRPTSSKFLEHFASSPRPRTSRCGTTSTACSTTDW
jgi:hypothetical protein